MIRINLLPARISRKKQAGRQQLGLILLAVVGAIVANVAWSQQRASELEGRRAKLRQTRDSITQIERIIGEVKTIKAQQAIVRDKLAVLEKLKAGRQGPVRVLDDLASLVPKKLWLRRFDEKAGAVTMEGVAASIDEVSAFLTALKRSQYFSVAELRKTNASAEKGPKLVNFTITATVNYTPTVQVASVTASDAGRR